MIGVTGFVVVFMVVFLCWFWFPVRRKAAAGSLFYSEKGRFAMGFFSVVSLSNVRF